MKFLLSITIFLGFLSCSDANRSEYLDTVTALETSLDSMRVILSENNDGGSTEMIAFSSEIGAKIDQLEMDTITYNLAVKLDRAERMGGLVELLEKEMTVLVLDFDAASASLEQLRDDIENDSGKRDQYDEYISFEQDKLNQLGERLSFCIDGLNEQKSGFDELSGVLEAELEAYLNVEEQEL